MSILVYDVAHRVLRSNLSTVDPCDLCTVFAVDGIIGNWIRSYVIQLYINERVASNLRHCRNIFIPPSTSMLASDIFFNWWLNVHSTQYMRYIDLSSLMVEKC